MEWYGTLWPGMKQSFLGLDSPSDVPWKMCHIKELRESIRTMLEAVTHGGFHKWGYPNSWMIYSGKSS